MTVIHVRRPSRLVPLALTGDDEAAHRWLEALEAAGIPAELHIEDGTRLVSGSSIFPTGQVFATSLHVAADHLDQAAALLIDMGWDGKRVGSAAGARTFDSRFMISAAVVAATLLGVIVTLLVRGV
jgi:hypothetical protein